MIRNSDRKTDSIGFAQAATKQTTPFARERWCTRELERQTLDGARLVNGDVFQGRVVVSLGRTHDGVHPGDRDVDKVVF